MIFFSLKVFRLREFSRGKEIYIILKGDYQCLELINGCSIYIYYLKVANKIFICLYVQSYNGKKKNLTAMSSMPSRTNLQIKTNKKQTNKKQQRLPD